MNEGQRVYFANPNAIANIFSRVTGADPSDILGTLGVDGAANLFFLNPNGIVFGPNASLNIEGSFVGTTANAIRFGERGFFSASTSEAPSDLLTVSPSAFFFNQISNQPANSIENRAFLTVSRGQSLLLLGGNALTTEAATGSVLLDGGRLRAPGGRVEIGGLAAPGEVVLVNQIAVSFPEDIRRANVSILNGAEIDVTSGGGGDISIYADSLNIRGGSDICAGIGANSSCGGLATDFGSMESRGGDIVLDAQSTIFIADPITEVTNVISFGGVGSTGNVEIRAEELSVQKGGQIGAGSFGDGDSGSVNILTSGDVLLEGPDVFIYSNVGSNDSGNSGGVRIEANSVRVTDIAQIQALTNGQGNSGDIEISAREMVMFDGSFSGAYSGVGSGAVGNSGGIVVKADSVILSNGAQLSSSVSGDGLSGGITVRAEDRVFLSDSSTFFTEISRGENVGDEPTLGGDISITTGTLVLRNGSQLRADTENFGNAGNITIFAREAVDIVGFGDGIRDGGRLAPDVQVSSGIFSTVETDATGEGGNITIRSQTLSMLDGSQIDTRTEGIGDAGNILIEAADSVSLVGIDALISSGVSRVDEIGGIGNGGNITITARDLSITNGSEIRADTEFQGDAGNIIINASERVTFNSGNAFSSVEAGAMGNGGSIEISTTNLEVLNEGQLIASTFGEGNAGSIIIDASNRVSFLGTSEDGLLPAAAFSTVERSGIGEAGDIEITARSLFVTNGARVVSRTRGQGDAGNITIRTEDDVFLNGFGNGGRTSGLFAEARDTSTGRGGNIEVTTDFFRVTGGAVADARTANSSRGGNVTITANTLEASDGGQIITVTEGGGDAGNIILNIEEAILLSGSDLTVPERLAEFGPDAVPNQGSASGLFANTASDSSGDGGRIQLQSNSIALRDSAQITVATFGEGSGGNVNLRIGSLALDNGAGINSNTAGQGDAGRLSILAADSISLTNNSTITSDVQRNATGDSQRITLQTPSLTLSGNSAISAATSGIGNPGEIRILDSDSIRLDDSTISTTVNRRAQSTTPGNIDIQTRQLTLTNGADIISSTAGQGDAGNVEIRVLDTISLTDSSIASEVTETANGEGGDITIRAGAFDLVGSQISSRSDRVLDAPNAPSPQTTNTSEIRGNAGNILIVVDDILFIQDSDITTQAAAFTGGAITIRAGDIRLFGDGDIQTSVQSGTAGGGDITLTADSILAFDDSDILAFAADGQGGNITVNTPAFFGEGFTLLSLDADPDELDGNDRVDINATGAFSGTVTLPDISFIQNSLAGLPAGIINTEALIANSCVARNQDGSSTFVITGPGGLPLRPGDLAPSPYPTGDVQTIPDDSQSWQPGDPIIEPDGVYQLPNGELILSHECR